jgi:hypothetical protein
VVAWYLRVHRATDDMGLPAMFCSSERVGAFAVDAAQLRAGDGDALARVLIATTMFQRRQDQQILRILQGMAPERVEALCSIQGLLRGAEEAGCQHLLGLDALLSSCDLDKDPVTKRGTCAANPEIMCPLKGHTEWLKRYGHFGKVPTSVALAIKARGVEDLAQLYELARASTEDRASAALWIEEALCAAWRINDKIAAMFLSAVSNPDLSPDGTAPWAEGLDWTRYVVIDSNVDLFLRAIGYGGSMSSYAARRAFICELAAEIDLAALDPSLHSYNPRLIQQAMYLFMSSTNRRTLQADCSREAPRSCAACDDALSARCPMRRAEVA